MVLHYIVKHFFTSLAKLNVIVYVLINEEYEIKNRAIFQ